MLKRREFLQAAAGLALTGRAGVLAAEQPTKRVPQCLPAVSGTLWWASAQQNKEWGAAGWEQELKEQQRLGFDLLWFVNAPSILDHPVLNLRALLDLCNKRKFKVILDTSFNGHWYKTLDLKDELELCHGNIRALGDQVAGHPAFLAWYIPHEIYMCWGKMETYINDLYPALLNACKAAANLPVTVSPFFILDRTGVFGNFQFNEPDEYRDFWAKLIRRSGLDIVMLQDSGEHFSYVTDQQRRPFFKAMSEACRETGSRLWGNVEVAEMECESIEHYEQRYGRVHHSAAKGITWRPVPLPRLKTKLTLAAEFSRRIVSWGYQEFCRPTLSFKAKAWHEAYQAYRKSL